MNGKLAVAAAGLWAISAWSPAQTSPAAPVKLDAFDVVRQIMGMVSKRVPSRRLLHEKADSLARSCVAELRQVSKQIDTLSKNTDLAVAQMGLQDKLNLAKELWRIRESLDLLQLLSPEVLENLVGMKILQLHNLVEAFAHTEKRLLFSIDPIRRL